MAAPPLTPDTVKWLNLLRESKSFVLLEDADGGVRVSCPRSIPPDSGTCWVSGTVKTPQARECDAVLIVDTGAGGELCGGYVWNGAWSHLDDLRPFIDVEPHEVHSFDYSLNVPLEVDHFR